MKTGIYILFFLIYSGLLAQNAERVFESKKVEKNIVEIEVNDGVYYFKSYNNEIIETNFIPAGQQYEPNLHAVVGKSVNLFQVKEDKDTIYCNTQGIGLKIVKKPFQLIYTYEGEKLISEKRGYIKTDSTEVLEFNLTKNEMLFGGGCLLYTSPSPRDA